MTTDVLAYIRVSTDKQEHGEGSQRTIIERAAEREGWRIIEWMVEEPRSASTMEDRPVLLEALDRMGKPDGPDALVAEKIDRIARNTLEFNLIRRQADVEGWTLIVLENGDMSSPSGELRANIEASVAQYELRIIKQRTERGLADARAKGIVLGHPPYGLRSNPLWREDKNAHDQWIVKEALFGAESQAEGREVLGGIIAQVEELRAQGASYTAVAEWLNGNGIPVPSGDSDLTWGPKQASRFVKAIEEGKYAQAAGIGE